MIDLKDTLAALGEATAYLYVRPDGWITVERNPQPDWVAQGWTETPLYRSGQLVPVPSVEVVGMTVANAIYGPRFDPHTNPETFAFCESIATAAIAAMKGEVRGDA